MSVVVTGARTDIDEFISRRMFEGSNHNNIVVLLVAEDGNVEARIITRWKELLALPPSTPCIQAWPGQWRSDMFTYTVADVLEHRA